MKKRLLVSVIPALACLAFAAPAFAATQEGASENWAGYVVTPNDDSGFSAVSGQWNQAAVACTANSQPSYSAYWVGLGGGSSPSDALEQEGTQVDCNADGSVKQYAWYELVPSAPVRIAMKVSAGDQMYARTAVSGDEVTVQVDDHTTGKSFTKTIMMTKATPDTSTAEWVAEAPSECSDSTLSDCQVLSLADFGTVKFTNAYATAGGHTGTVSDSRFSSTPVALAGSDGFLGGGYGGYGYSGGSTAGSSGYGESSSSGYGQSSSSGYGQSSSGYGQSGDGESSSGDGDGGYGDDGSDGYGYSDGSGWAGSGWGMGYGPIASAGEVSDSTTASLAGAAAPSTLSDGGTTFSVYYGQEPTGGSSSSLTGSSSSTGSGTGSGTGSTGDSWGESGSTSPWGDSGYGSDGASGYSQAGSGGSDSASGDSFTIGGYTLSWGPDGLTVSAA